MLVMVSWDRNRAEDMSETVGVESEHIDTAPSPGGHEYGRLFMMMSWNVVGNQTYRGEIQDPIL